MTTDNNNLLPVHPQASEKKFSGFTIDELRYKIVYTTLQKEFCKDKLFSSVRKTMDTTPFTSSGKKNMSGVGGTMLSGLLKGLSYADYFVVGFSLFKSVKSIFKLIRRKK